MDCVLRFLINLTSFYFSVNKFVLDIVFFLCEQYVQQTAGIFMSPYAHTQSSSVNVVRLRRAVSDNKSPAPITPTDYDVA